RAGASTTGTANDDAERGGQAGRRHLSGFQPRQRRGPLPPARRLRKSGTAGPSATRHRRETLPQRALEVGVVAAAGQGRRSLRRRRWGRGGLEDHLLQGREPPRLAVRDRLALTAVVGVVLAVVAGGRRDLHPDHGFVVEVEAEAADAAAGEARQEPTC